MKRTNQENYIKTIAEVRSISAAAEVLGISQPALSSFLKKKESDLGVAIFDRSSQPLELTEAGKIYLKYLDRKYALKKELFQNISDIRELKTGNISIGGSSFFNMTYLPEAVSAFARDYPSIDIEIIDGKVPELSRMAYNGLLDIFLTPTADNPDRFNYEELLEEKIFICVPKDWPLNDELLAGEPSGHGPHLLSPDGFRAVCKHDLIRLREEQDIGRRMGLLFRKYGCKPERTISAEQTLTSLVLTRASVGASMITESCIKGWNTERLPEIYYLDDELCRRKIYIAYPSNKYLSSAAREMIEHIKAENITKKQ